MLTNRKRIKLPRHPPTMSPVFTPNNYAPLYHALLANGNIHLFVSTNRSSPPISWPITARLRFKPRRLGCDPREPGSGTRGAPWNMIQDPALELIILFVIMKFWSINPSPDNKRQCEWHQARSVLSSSPSWSRGSCLPSQHLRPNDILNESLST